MSRQLTYDQTMAWGASEWSEVIERIRREGLGQAEFTQTGGMCAAIVVGVEAGYYLLLTDIDDTLSWERDAHQGWYVGLYPPENEDSSEPIAYLEHLDGTTPTRSSASSAQCCATVPAHGVESRDELSPVVTISGRSRTIAPQWGVRLPDTGTVQARHARTRFPLSVASKSPESSPPPSA